MRALSRLCAAVAGCWLAGTVLFAQSITTLGMLAAEHSFENVVRGDQNGDSGRIYGYLTHVSGADDARLFTAPRSATDPARGEANARLTISGSVDVTGRYVLGNMIITSGTGSFTIYYNNTPRGDFNQPETFSSGTPVATFQVRSQNVLNVQTPLSAQSPGRAIILSTTDMLQLGSSAFTLDGGSYAVGRGGVRYHHQVTGQGTLLSAPPFVAVFLMGGFAEVFAQPVLPPRSR